MLALWEGRWCEAFYDLVLGFLMASSFWKAVLTGKKASLSQQQLRVIHVQRWLLTEARVLSLKVLKSISGFINSSEVSVRPGSPTGLLLWYLGTVSETSATVSPYHLVQVLRFGFKIGKWKQRNFMNTMLLVKTKDFGLGSQGCSCFRCKRWDTGHQPDLYIPGFWCFPMCLRCFQVAMMFCQK